MCLIHQVYINFKASGQGDNFDHHTTALIVTITNTKYCYHTTSYRGQNNCLVISFFYCLNIKVSYHQSDQSDLV